MSVDNINDSDELELKQVGAFMYPEDHKELKLMAIDKDIALGDFIAKILHAYVKKIKKEREKRGGIS